MDQAIDHLEQDNQNASSDAEIKDSSDDTSKASCPMQLAPLNPPPKTPRRALITGAASGIGRCVAVECAKKKWPLVLVDINNEGLEQVAEELRTTYAIEIHTFAIDLSATDAPQKCLDFCDANNLQIDFLANIAGIFTFDPLLDAPQKRTDLMLDLHVKTVTNMCIAFGERMRQRRYGFIMNMSSMSAWMPMPGISTYNASKSYIRSLSRSLRFELLPWNVSVTAVCPGGCNTPLLPISDKIRSLGVKLRCLMEPEKLAEKAVKATIKRKAQTIPGIFNKFCTVMMRCLPDWLIRIVVKRLAIYKRFYPNP